MTPKIPTESAVSAQARRRNPPGQGRRLRDEIVEAAMRLLERGAAPSALSLRAVAREAQITAPAIYPHFGGMDELLSAIVTRRFDDFTRALDGEKAALAAPASPRDVLLARTLAYCRFGIDRPGDYELLFGRGEAYGGVPYENSAGEAAFADLVARVAATGEAHDADAIAAVLWPALHGIVHARRELSGFPWPPLEEQVHRLVDGLVPVDSPR